MSVWGSRLVRLLRGALLLFQWELCAMMRALRVGMFAVGCVLFGFNLAQTWAEDSASNIHVLLQNGEFAPALAAANNLPAKQRDKFLAEIATAQANANGKIGFHLR